MKPYILIMAYKWVAPTCRFKPIMAMAKEQQGTTLHCVAAAYFKHSFDQLPTSVCALNIYSTVSSSHVRKFEHQ